MTLIFNASPLIVLAKCGLLDRLLGLADTVVLPMQVAQEIERVNDPEDAARSWIEESARRDLIRQAPEIPSFVTAWDLGPGESAVIALGTINPGAFVVLDDLPARRCAQALGLPLVGTLGLILMAKQQGILSSVSPALDAICASGLYISPQQLASVRQQAGE